MIPAEKQKKIAWLNNPDIRPYVFVRKESLVDDPGKLHRLDWFRQKPLLLDPMRMVEVNFADRILHLEAKAFGPKNLQMPRWVFYDCAIMPGFVAGFAQRTSTLSEPLRKAFAGVSDHEWTPLSLFIIIPTMAPGEWVAHNLCSTNSMFPREQNYYGLGFLSKAFGLWYANIDICCGMTQWMSPSMPLHTHYGPFEVLTAYTPVHSYALTLTYRVKVQSQNWYRFFTQEADPQFSHQFQSAGFEVDPANQVSIIEFQRKLEAGHGPYYLSGREVKSKKLNDRLTVYRPRCFVKISICLFV